MATIKPIEGSSVHRIQSGQVIVDLCSVVKELLENSLDAGATSIDVRFKNHGLDAIEVQDNGSGISKEDYESIALKHHTSKLSDYDDLETLDTFGFRGEALSSLCALSNVHIVTAREDEAPKGTRLDFEISGKLKGTSVIAAQRGTTVSVETIFKNIPVRRQELDKNIKREYAKVLALMQAYACINTNVRLSVSNVIGKKKVNAFSTKGNKTTWENIANVYSAKILSSLVALDLRFEMQAGPSLKTSSVDRKVAIIGHISRPVVGGGRALPDRQMFFVNSRPCTLPQVSKAFNEVYKPYNLSQSPFIFANLLLDTSAYDVNVSPDKRSILLHDQGAMLQAIKEDLTRLFEEQQQTVPQSQTANVKLPAYKPLIITHQSTLDDEAGPSQANEEEKEGDTAHNGLARSSSGFEKIDLIQQFAEQRGQSRDPGRPLQASTAKDKLIRKFSREASEENIESSKNTDSSAVQGPDTNPLQVEAEKKQTEIVSARALLDTSTEMCSDSPPSTSPANAKNPVSNDFGSEEDIPSISTTPVKSLPGVVPNAFDRMRPQRMPVQKAIITIGDKTVKTTIGSGFEWPRRNTARRVKTGKLTSQMARCLRSFAAPGTQISISDEEDEDDEDSRENENSNGRNLGRVSSSHSLGVHSATEEDTNPSSPTKQTNATSSGEESEHADGDSTDGEYLDEETKKKREEARVARLIQRAEEKAARPSEANVKRAQRVLKGGHKYSTTKLVQNFNASLSSIERKLQSLTHSMNSLGRLCSNESSAENDDSRTAEERLSLSVSKSDFSRMRVVGQFNLGFIIALRTGTPAANPSLDDEVFIIDQHASDEKFNFERLQAETTMQNQRLVQPQVLDLTAIEEEIIADNESALLKNGFKVVMDNDGSAEVGKRCTLISLPTSKEVTFDTRDLEELLALLSESPTTSSIGTNPSSVPRPGKVRRLFAMRACRSSVMIGKTLTSKRMEKLVRQMGTIDKPWNCPHGRPTMRHLLGLGKWEGWSEERGVVGMEEVTERPMQVDWGLWLGGEGSSEDERDLYGDWASQRAQLGEKGYEDEEQEQGKGGAEQEEEKVSVSGEEKGEEGQIAANTQPFSRFEFMPESEV